jgi:alpha-tubulin suppressor-like RCC1 family protein
MHRGFDRGRGCALVGGWLEAGLRCARACWAVAAAVALVVVLACAATADAGSGVPVNTKLPTLSGSPKEERTLTVKAGKWSPEATSYEYTWVSCLETKCSERKERTTEATATYLLTAESVLHTIAVTVVASNSSGASLPASAAETEEVTGYAPKSEGAPVITGYLAGEKVEPGLKLSVSSGKWSGTTPQEYTYLWEACTSKKTCRAESTESSYVVGSLTEGDTLHAVVTATNTIAKNDHGTASTSVSPPAAVTSGPAVNYEAPIIKGEAAEGQMLEASAGAWAGTPTITYEYQWKSCTSPSACLPISGTKGVGATSSFSPGALQVGETIEVEFTGTNAHGSSSATSAPTAAVKGRAPKNTELPKIEGEAREGQELKATSGTWEGTSPIEYTSYAWSLCGKEGCHAIEGASGAKATSYGLIAADVGDTIEVTVTARNRAGEATASSAPTATVLGNAPTVKELPRIEGEAREGQALKATSGAWEGPMPIEYTNYVWSRCGKEGCHAIEGASGAKATSYTPVAADVGDTIEVTVTAKNAYAEASATAPATATVLGNPPTNRQPPHIEGEALEGRELKAAPGVWEGTPQSGPEPFTYAYQWQLCRESGCSAIAGATTSTYALSEEDVGATIKVIVSAKGGVEPAGERASSATSVVKGVAPVSTGAPTITGAAEEDATLTASAGTWESKEPLTYTYTWKSCLKEGECSETSGSANTYTLSSADVGNTVSVTVTATNKGGSATSAPSAGTQLVIAVGGSSAVAWGNDYYGQLGTIYKVTREPFRVPFGSGIGGITSIADGEDGYAILNTGEAIAAGGGGKGQLGDNSKDHSYFAEKSYVYVDEQIGEEKVGKATKILTARGKGFKSIAAASDHALALMKNGNVEAWGQNEWGENGNGQGGFETETEERSTVPHTVETLTPSALEAPARKLPRVSAVFAGGPDDFAVLGSGEPGQGEVMGWGNNADGATGVAKSAQESCNTELGGEPCVTTPSLVLKAAGEGESQLKEEGEPLTEVVEVAGNEVAAYARTKTGHVWSWGSNANGALGRGAGDQYTDTSHTRDQYALPVLNAKGEQLSGVEKIAAGGEHAIALLADGEVLGWGEATGGQLGVAPASECGSGIESRQQPRGEAFKAEREEEVTKEGKLFEYRHPCVRAAQPAVAQGGLGGSKITAISSGLDWNLALTEAGDVYSWGGDGHDQLGYEPARSLRICMLKTKAACEECRKEKPKECAPSLEQEEEVTWTRVPEQVKEPGRVTAIAAGTEQALVLLQQGVTEPPGLMSLTPTTGAHGEPAFSLAWPSEIEGVSFQPYRVTWKGARATEPTETSEDEKTSITELGPVSNAGVAPEIETRNKEAPEVDQELKVTTKGRWNGERLHEGASGQIENGLTVTYEWQLCEAELGSEAMLNPATERYTGGLCKEAPLEAERGGANYALNDPDDAGTFPRIVVTVKNEYEPERTEESAGNGTKVKSEATEASATLGEILKKGSDEGPGSRSIPLGTTSEVLEELQVKPYEVALDQRLEHTTARGAKVTESESREARQTP